MLGSVSGTSSTASSSASYVNPAAQRRPEGSPTANHNVLHQSYAGMGTNPPPGLRQTARRAALVAKLEAALARMKSESATDEDKLSVVSVLTAFDGLSAAIKGDRRLAIKIGEALEAQCKLLNVGNRSVELPLSIERPQAGPEADLLRHIETLWACGPEWCSADWNGYESKRFVLNANILESSKNSNGATRALKAWCERHGLAGSLEVKVKAKRVQTAPERVDERLLKRLQVNEPDNEPEEVRYRRVQLHIEGNEEFVLSEADNWYVPSRLDDEMNRRLDETDDPFGIVVEPLNFRRKTDRVDMDVEEALSVHQAILCSELCSEDGKEKPFSAVQEFYQSKLMVFPPKAVTSKVENTARTQ